MGVIQQNLQQEKEEESSSKMSTSTKREGSFSSIVIFHEKKVKRNLPLLSVLPTWKGLASIDNNCQELAGIGTNW